MSEVNLTANEVSGEGAEALAELTWCKAAPGVMSVDDASGRCRGFVCLGRLLYGSREWHWTAYPADFHLSADQSDWTPNPKCQQGHRSGTSHSIEEATECLKHSINRLDEEAAEIRATRAVHAHLTPTEPTP